MYMSSDFLVIVGMLTIIASTAESKTVNCTSKQFACRNGKQCVNVDKFCNGRVQCRDGSDEPQYWNKHKSYGRNITVCRGFGSKFRYPHFCVLPDYLLKDKDRLCSDKNYCEEGTVACHDNSQCISIYAFCNDQKDCRDGSDEPPRRNNNQYYSNDNSFCRSSNEASASEIICVLPEYLMPNKSSICQPDWRCERKGAASEIECVDGSQCLDPLNFCNELAQCRDGSDEVTSPSEAWFEGRMCRRASQPTENPPCMLQKTHICDGAATCQEEIDECLCGDDGKYFLDKSCFQCLSNPAYVIPTSRLCDGIIDCPDFTDECLCHYDLRPKICNLMKNEIGNGNDIPFSLECATFNNETVRINISSACDNKLDCKDGEDEMYCRREGSSPPKRKVKDFRCEVTRKMATSCDGIIECSDYINEECNCTTTPEFCVNVTKTSICRIFNGTGIIGLGGQIMCDGVKTCDNFKDELGCEASRFYCTDGPLPNIPIEKRCDLQDDCANAKDEMNCPHFYCNDGGNLKYIHKYAVCDGVQDCMAGSDECQPNCIVSAFSDEKSMIKSKVMLAVVWIFSIISIVGCSTVVVSTSHDLLNLRKGRHENISGHTKISKILIMNLSISDFLVGVYTISICIKALQFEGSYCLADQQWRSSMMCSSLGAVLIIGSEQSVFTMVLITIQRLHAISRPLARPRFLRLGIVIAISWLLSLIFGLVPLSVDFEDYFVRSIKNIEWSFLRQRVNAMNPNITLSYQFGYYSSHTVCLPTFFPYPARDQAWGYSLLLLTINFIAFIFMLIAYIMLYRKATKTKALETVSLRKNRSKQNTRIQRKLTRILMSDFLCWMPVCIMGFLQLGGVDIPRDAYLPVGLLIIPINSALNPLLYSDLPEIIERKLRKAKATLTDSIRRRNSHTDSARTTGTNIPL